MKQAGPLITMFGLVILWVILFGYFYTMQAGKPGTIDEARLTLSISLNRRVVLDAAFCLCPAVVLYLGSPYDLNSNLAFTSFILTTLIAPLTLEHPNNRFPFLNFVARWASGKFDFWIKGICVAGVVYGFGWLFGFDSDFSHGLLEHAFLLPSIKVVHPHLTLPTMFYVLSLGMILMRTGFLFGGKWYMPFVGFFCGLCALTYFFNLTFAVQLTEAHWETPVGGGILGALLYNFVCAYIAADSETAST
jgi:hypothetical protein